MKIVKSDESLLIVCPHNVSLVLLREEKRNKWKKIVEPNQSVSS